MGLIGKRQIFQLASSAGDGTGDTNAIGDYSAAEQVLYVQPDENDYYIITRMIVGIEDAGTLDSGAYGNSIILTNGIVVRVSNSDAVKREMTPFPVKTNGEWAMTCHDFTAHEFGQGNSVASARWTFEKCGTPLILNGKQGDKLEIVLNDDFSGLVTHRFFVQGYYLDESDE